MNLNDVETRLWQLEQKYLYDLPECKEDELLRCSECGCFFSEKEMQILDGNGICEECYEKFIDETVICERCGERCEKTYTEHKEGKTICKACKELLN